MKKAVIVGLLVASLLGETAYASDSSLKLRVLPLECTINIVDLGMGPVEQITPAGCDQPPVVKQLGVFGVEFGSAPTQPSQTIGTSRSFASSTQTVTVLDQPFTQPPQKSAPATWPTQPAPTQSAQPPHPVDIVTTISTASAGAVFADVMIFRGRATRYIARGIKNLPPKWRK